MLLTQEVLQELKHGSYKASIPDFYSLATVIENNPWHVRQPVLDHSLLSAHKLLQLLGASFLPAGSHSTFRGYFERQIDDVSRLELFKIAVLLHDIGKLTTLVVQPDGSTWCPGHAAKGADMVPDEVTLFDLTTKQTTYVAEVVRYHMVPFELLGAALETGDVKTNTDMIKATAPDLFPELLLLAYADMSGCILAHETEPNYEARADIIRDELSSFFAS